MIIHDNFWKTLESKNISTYQLIEKHNINRNTLTRMRQGKYISTRTIDDFCKILNCEVSDIIEFKSEDTADKK